MTHPTASLSRPHHLKLVSVGEMQAIEQADDEHPGAERFEVFGREAEPEALARSGQHQRRQQ